MNSELTLDRHIIGRSRVGSDSMRHVGCYIVQSHQNLIRGATLGWVQDSCQGPKLIPGRPLA